MRRYLGLGVLIGLDVLLCQPTFAQSDKENQIRAAFIYNFTKFVEWPTSPQPSFKVLILGAKDLEGPLSAFKTKGKLFQNRTVEILYSEKPEFQKDIQILVIDYGDEKEFKQALKLFDASPTLTINNKSEFAKKGAMITFVKKADETLGFGLNLKRISNQKLKVNSQLTKLAELEPE